MVRIEPIFADFLPRKVRSNPPAPCRPRSIILASAPILATWSGRWPFL